MPVHDWTRVDAGLFHAFRHGWISALSEALNRNILPTDFFALIEPAARLPVANILTPGEAENAKLPEPRPDQAEDEAVLYARKADRITVRHRHGEVVAVLEIVSPGNKASTSELRAFVEPVGVGDELPDMPLFLRPECYVPAPLEATYQTSWSHFPAALKGLLGATP